MPQAVLQTLEIKHGSVSAGLSEVILEQITDLQRLRKLLKHAVLSNSIKTFAAQL